MHASRVLSTLAGALEIGECLFATGEVFALASPGIQETMTEIARKSMEYVAKHGINGSICTPVLETLIAEPTLAARLGVAITSLKLPETASEKEAQAILGRALGDKKGVVAVHIGIGNLHVFKAHVVPNPLLHFQRLINNIPARES